MNRTIEEITKALRAPFPKEDIEWRIGALSSDGTKAQALAYVDNRAIQDRLDEVVGIDNWRNEFVRWGEGSVLCGLSLRINGEWITKWDGADETDRESTKGGLSNAMKRAAYQWGIGRYLYNLPVQWVPVKKRGNSYVFAETPKLPDWALPEYQRGQELEPSNGPQPQAQEEANADIPADKPAPGEGDEVPAKGVAQVVCMKCGAAITKAVAVYSKKRFGQQLCMKCQQPARSKAVNE